MEPVRSTNSIIICWYFVKFINRIHRVNNFINPNTFVGLVGKVRIKLSPEGLRKGGWRKKACAVRPSGVTPMGSGWANPRAPGQRGHPQGASSLYSVPTKITLSTRGPFQKVNLSWNTSVKGHPRSNVPAKITPREITRSTRWLFPTLFFHSLVAKFS